MGMFWTALFWERELLSQGLEGSRLEIYGFKATEKAIALAKLQTEGRR